MVQITDTKAICLFKMALNFTFLDAVEVQYMMEMRRLSWFLL